MKHFKIITLALITLAFINLTPFNVAAQSDFSPEDPGGDPSVPIDGGSGILIAAGVGYVLKKYHYRNNYSTKM